jgi:hypothetical protein
LQDEDVEGHYLNQCYVILLATETIALTETIGEADPVPQDVTTTPDVHDHTHPEMTGMTTEGMERGVNVLNVVGVVVVVEVVNVTVADLVPP